MFTHRRSSSVGRIACLLLLAAGLSAAEDSTGGPADWQRDDFTLQEAGGDRSFALLSARGEWVALHFLLKTTCPYCLRHTHDYTTRAAEVPGVRHIFIKPDTDEEIAAWALNLAGRFDNNAAVAAEIAGLPVIYRDPNATLAKLFEIPDGYPFHGQVVHYPALVLLDPLGQEVFRYVGSSNSDRFAFDDFAAKIAALEAIPTRGKTHMTDPFPWPEDRIEQYTAHRAVGPITVDGHLNEASWIHAPRSPRFSDLVNGTPGIHDTRAAVLWDDDYLYVGYWVEEPMLEATLKKRDDLIYMDNDIEFFIAGPGAYYEFEINTFGTIYEVFFIWDDAYEKMGYSKQAEFSKDHPQAKPFPGVGFQPHPRGGRTGFWNWDFPGLQSAVVADGTINDNADRDRGWTVELALPWKGMKWLANGDGRALPPKDGDVWRMDFSRFNTYKQAPPANDHGGWAWSPHGVWDSHVPECFPYITFSDQPVIDLTP